MVFFLAIFSWFLVFITGVLLIVFSLYFYIVVGLVWGSGGKDAARSLQTMIEDNKIIKILFIDIFGSNNPVSNIFFLNEKMINTYLSTNSYGDITFSSYGTPSILIAISAIMIFLSIRHFKKIKRVNFIPNPFIKILLMCMVIFFLVLGKVVTSSASLLLLLSFIFLEMLWGNTFAVSVYYDKKEIKFFQRQDLRFARHTTGPTKVFDKIRSKKPR